MAKLRWGNRLGVFFPSLGTATLCNVDWGLDLGSSSESFSPPNLKTTMAEGWNTVSDPPAWLSIRAGAFGTSVPHDVGPSLSRCPPVCLNLARAFNMEPQQVSSAGCQRILIEILCFIPIFINTNTLRWGQRSPSAGQRWSFVQNPFQRTPGGGGVFAFFFAANVYFCVWEFEAVESSSLKKTLVKLYYLVMDS